MGNSVSKFVQERAARAKSDAIDRELDKLSKKLQKECKILLLGISETGKSTILKQMKIINQNGFSTEELMSYRPMIYQNTLDSAHAIILAMREMNLDCIHPLNRENAVRILDWKIVSPDFVLTREMAQAIYNLWQDPIIPTVLDHAGSQFHLMDSAAYFFTEVRRMASEYYLPTVDDVLRVRARSTGIMEIRFNMGQLPIHMFDVGGQRSERKKWIQCFEGVTCIIFCTALSDYDQFLFEAKEQNRMEESLILFQSVINSRWFLRTSIILLLNKVDVFKVKLPKVPLEKYFPEYTGGADINKAGKYILWRFMQANRARLSIFPHLTQATDTSNILPMCRMIKEAILQNTLKLSGIL